MSKAVKIARWLAYSAGLTALIILGLTVAWYLRQPRHDGRTVQAWFSLACGQYRGQLDPKQEKEIRIAFEKMGSNAVPFLITQIEVPFLTRYSRPFGRAIEQLRYNPRVPILLRRLLPDPADDSMRVQTAFDLLRSMGTAAISARPALERILLRPDFYGYYEVFEVLRSFGVGASNSAPVVARFFVSTNDVARDQAVITWGVISPPKTPYSSNLISAVEQRYVRAAQAIPVLSKLEIDFAILLPILGDELCSTNSSWHSAALAVCGAFGLHPNVLIPRFADAMRDPDARFRAQLLQSLRPINQDRTAALSAVLEAMNDLYSFVRAEAAKTLVALDPHGDDPRVLEALRARRNDTNEYVAETVNAALKTLQEQAR